jgi:hypothetical protein
VLEGRSFVRARPVKNLAKPRAAKLAQAKRIAAAQAGVPMGGGKS